MKKRARVDLLKQADTLVVQARALAFAIASTKEGGLTEAEQTGILERLRIALRAKPKE